MQIMKLIYNSQEPSKLAISLLHHLYSSWICYGLFYMVKCIEKNLHIFSIGYEFSHDVAYKAHIFGFCTSECMNDTKELSREGWN